MYRVFLLILPRLQGNVIEIYSTLNKGKFVAAERLITALKNKIYKYMTSISNICILIN